MYLKFLITLSKSESVKNEPLIQFNENSYELLVILLLITLLKVNNYQWY